MRANPKALLVAACLMSFVVLLGLFNAGKPRILVLHSAGPQSSWATAVDRGIKDALATNRRPVSIEYQYLDVNGPAAAARAGQAQADARRAIDRIDPDVLIAVDDEANDLVARNYVGRQVPRILYVSLDRAPSDYGYADAPNVSGIAERLPFPAIRDMITTLAPGARPSVSILGVAGVTGRAEMAQALAADWGPLRIGDTRLVSTAGSWRDAVTTARSDYLIVLSCADLPDRDGSLFTAGDAARWTEQNSRALPIGIQSNFVANGGALALAPDPADDGSSAIRLALDWLDTRSSPGPPPPVASDHFTVAIGESALARRGIAVPTIYIEAARANGTLLG